MKTIELVTFRLKDESDRDVFLAASATMQEQVMRDMPGYISRMLTQADDGTWRDIVLWASVAEATTAAEKIMSCPPCQQAFAYIDESSIDMQHYPVQQHYAA